MTILTQYLRSSDLKRLNERLRDAGYPNATPDHGDKGAYVNNLISRLAGANPAHQREVEHIISAVIGYRDDQ